MEKNIINLGQDKTQSEVQGRMGMKFLTPLLGEFFTEDGIQGGKALCNGGELLAGIELVQYEDAIREAVDRENILEGDGGTVCNLMEYFYGSISIKEKVEQAVVSVENVGGILYGCTTFQVKGLLGSGEQQELCEYIIGQYNEGWGKGFGQRNIQVNGGKLNVHFRQRGIPKLWIQEVKEKDPDPGKEKPYLQEKKMCR